MSANNSARYTKNQQAIAEREIPDGLASPAPTLPPVPKAQRKAEKAMEKKAKADAKSRAKTALPKPRILYSVSKGKGRKRKPKKQEKRKRAKKPQGKDCCRSRYFWMGHETFN